MSKLSIQELVEAAYLHGLCVENLDTGELEPPHDISEVQWITDRIKSLMLDMIGADEKPDTGGGVAIMAIYNGRNQLRAELRRKVEEL